VKNKDFDLSLPNALGGNFLKLFGGRMPQGMKAGCIILFLTLFLFASPAYGAQTGIPLGESLVYGMSWLGVPIGTAELWVKEKMTMNGKEVFHVVGTMQTNNFLSVIYPVHNEIHSWIDAETLTSVKFEKKISEGRTRAHEIIEFPKPEHDVISAFYWVRRQSLIPGQSVRVVVIADRKEWTLEVAVLKRQTLELRGWGAVNTLLVEPKSRVAGSMEKRGKSLVNFSDDIAKIPLRITYKAPFGRISGVLMKNSVSSDGSLLEP